MWQKVATARSSPHTFEQKTVMLIVFPKQTVTFSTRKEPLQNIFPS